MYNELFGVLKNVAEGILATVAILVFLRYMRATISISPRIAHTYNRAASERETVYLFKVVNLTRRPVTNVHGELSLVMPVNVPNGQTLVRHPIPLVINNVMEIGGYRRGDDSARYAWLFTCTEDLDMIWTDDTHAYLEMRVSATHSLSGHVKVFIRDFRMKRDTIAAGDFEFGRGMDIR